MQGPTFARDECLRSGISIQLIVWYGQIQTVCALLSTELAMIEQALSSEREAEEPVTTETRNHQNQQPPVQSSPPTWSFICIKDSLL